MLTKDFLPWQSVYYQYRKWCQQEIWFLIYRALHQLSQVQVGREAQASATAIDSQSVKTTAPVENRGLDEYKKIKGRKRHAIEDTMGISL